MVFGKTLFICDECGNKFIAPNAEYMAMAFSMPVPCTKCGSNHTMPASVFSLLGKLNPQRAMYRKIWAEMDKKKRQ